MAKYNSINLIARFIFIITISFWIGSMFFFAVITAQTIFSALPAELAGRVISAFFDKYYPLQYIFGLILTSVSLFFLVKEGASYQSIWFKRLVLVIGMLVITLFSGTYIRSSAKNAKEVMKNSTQTSYRYVQANNKFRSSHRNSVAANGLVFLLGIVILLDISYRNKI